MSPRQPGPSVLQLRSHQMASRALVARSVREEKEEKDQ